MADANTALLIHSDTTDGSTTFTDSSGNTLSITAEGNPQHEVDQKKFGTTSIYFDGNDALTTSSSDFVFGTTDDFTIDFWYYPEAFASNQYLFDFGTNDGALSLLNGGVRYYNITLGTGSVLYSTVPAITLAVWVHLAIVRASGITTLYLDGVAKANDTDGYDYATQLFYLCRYGGGGNFCNGYIDEFRISAGIARWTSNFTPPTAPYNGETTVPGFFQDIKITRQIFSPVLLGGV